MRFLKLIRIYSYAMTILVSLAIIIGLASCELKKLPTNSYFDEIAINHNIKQIEVEINYDALLDLETSRYTNNWFEADAKLISPIEQFQLNSFNLRNQGHKVRDDLKFSYRFRWYDSLEHKANYSAQSRDVSMLRYKFAAYYFNKLNMLQPQLEYYNLFINQQWQGLYLRIELIDASFFISRDLEISDTFRVLRNGQLSMTDGQLATQGFEKKIPENIQDYTKLQKLILAIDNGIAQDTSEIVDLIDINNVINYISVSKLINNYDGITNNFYLYFNTKNNKFQIIPWDLDATFTGSAKLSTPLDNHLFSQIESVPVWRDKVEKTIDSLLELEQDLKYLDSLENLVHPYMSQEYMYSNNPEDKFKSSVQQIREYLNKLKL